MPVLSTVKWRMGGTWDGSIFAWSEKNTSSSVSLNLSNGERGGCRRSAAKTACRLRGGDRGFFDSLDCERSRNIPAPWIGCRAGLYCRGLAGGSDAGRRQRWRRRHRRSSRRRRQAGGSGYSLRSHSGQSRHRFHGGAATNPAGRGIARQEHRGHSRRYRNGFFHADILAPKRARARSRCDDPADGRFAGDRGRP